jgi:hypothetical protein
MWGWRSKACHGRNRGWDRGCLVGCGYGDFGVADEALVGLRELVAGIVRGGNEDDELFWGGSARVLRERGALRRTAELLETAPSCSGARPEAKRTGVARREAPRRSS